MVHRGLPESRQTPTKSGPAFSTKLTNEVFYKDFRNRREVGRYVGLTPSPRKSGGIDRG